MNMLDLRHRQEWRTWLSGNGTQCREIWLVYYKKNSGRASISYEDSIEEALCFGWVDGKIQRLDELRCARRFTPRKPDSPWSASNIDRVKRLKAAGMMTPQGLAVFHPDRRRDAETMPKQFPPQLEKAFKKNAAAWKNFQNFPAYYRRMTTAWVASAKREETELKRLEKLIVSSSRNERIQFM